MPTITGINVQQKNPDRYNLLVDGKFVCGITIPIISEFKLAVNEILSDKQIELIRKSSEESKLYDRVLNYLSVRPRSKDEIKKHLQKILFKKKIQIENFDLLFQSIIERLEKYNYVNDEDFVKWWIENRIMGRNPSGKRKIMGELLQKGIDKKIIEDVWNTLQVDSSQLLVQILSKLTIKYDVKDPRQKKKLVDTLLRKGFSWDDIRSVLQ